MDMPHAAPRWHADAIASPLGAIDHQAHAHQLLQPLATAPCLTDNMAKCHFLSFNCPCFTCPRRFPGVLTASSCFTWSRSLQRTGYGLLLPLNGMMPATMQCRMTMPRFNALSLILVRAIIS
ncbi:hypothetical protein J3E69DRAFT_330180 [Trichoderma sp. SZMC 28015]